MEVALQMDIESYGIFYNWMEDTNQFSITNCASDHRISSVDEPTEALIWWKDADAKLIDQLQDFFREHPEVTHDQYKWIVKKNPHSVTIIGNLPRGIFDLHIVDEPMIRFLPNPFNN